VPGVHSAVADVRAAQYGQCNSRLGSGWVDIACYCTDPAAAAAGEENTAHFKGLTRGL
jgi:hypothetical protein